MDMHEICKHWKRFSKNTKSVHSLPKFLPIHSCNVPIWKNYEQLTDKHDVCLVVDDTIGNFFNLNLLQTGLADVVCTSLTKLFSGRGDVMAGSLIANPNTRIGSLIQQDLSQLQQESTSFKPMHGPFGTILIPFKNAMLALIIRQVNWPIISWNIQMSNEFIIPNIHVIYTKYALRQVLVVYSPYYWILTFVNEPFTMLSMWPRDRRWEPILHLACPYTLLAHYHELDFAMSYNVQPNLLRITVGLEDLEELREKFSTALAVSRLHPKITSGNSNSAGGAVRPYSTTTTTTRTRLVVKQRSPSFLCGKNRSSIRAALKMFSRGRGVAL